MTTMCLAKVRGCKMALDELKMIADEQRWEDALLMIQENPELKKLNIFVPKY